VPAHDEHGVRNTHLCRITYLCLVCPAKVGHGSGNFWGVAGYSGSGRKSCNGLASLPWLALADPAQRRFGRVSARVLRWQVLAVAPGAAGAVLVMPLAARNADHRSSLSRTYGADCRHFRYDAVKAEPAR
jgi:hypothetical protein